MPTERLSMRRIRQILQLHFEAHASARVIARELGIGRSTVQGYLARVPEAVEAFKTALADARAAEDHLRKVLVEGGWLQ